jgi:hypothetical protein
MYLDVPGRTAQRSRLGQPTGVDLIPHGTSNRHNLPIVSGHPGQHPPSRRRPLRRRDRRVRRGAPGRDDQRRRIAKRDSGTEPIRSPCRCRRIEYRSDPDCYRDRHRRDRHRWRSRLRVEASEEVVVSRTAGQTSGSTWVRSGPGRSPLLLAACRGQGGSAYGPGLPLADEGLAESGWRTTCSSTPGRPVSRAASAAVRSRPSSSIESRDSGTRTM